jgi:hypothetical protein
MSGIEMSEEQLVRAFLDLAARTGWRAVHYRPARTNQGWRTALEGHPGAPDIIAVHPSRGVLLVEAKSKTGRLRPDQEDWRIWSEKAAERYPGAIRYALIRPANLFDGTVESLLQGGSPR